MGLLLPVAGLRGQTTELPAVAVSATRVAEPPEDMPVAVDEITSQELQSPTDVTLDASLRQDPSFSLFRRTSSLTSNPTSQGVSLRGIGPSGASRSLVVLDGVPVNDPFGGWVVWTGLPRLDLARADLVKGGGSGIWGNEALAGTIELVTAQGEPGSGAFDFSDGAFDTRSAEVALTEALGPGSISVDARDFATDGFYDLLPADRGPVDRPFNSSHQMAQIRLQEPLSGGLEVVATGRVFAEDRGNGTLLQQNASHSALASLALDWSPSPAFSSSAVAYVERESYSSVFSSVNAARTVETPADDQFDVPATAAGAALTARWQEEGGASTAAGLDVRQVVGETREDTPFVNGAFTGVRFAGGAQDFAGAFLHRDQPLTQTLEFSADLRADEWENRDGHDREYSLLTGAPTALHAYPTATGGAFSPNLGLIWRPAQGWRLHAAAYHGFRLPTLNEYYRPFRVGSVLTDANPDLAVETLDGVEAGVDYDRGPFRAGLTAFGDELYHSVGTVTLSQTPSLTTLERANIDAVRVPGAEASASWSPGKAFSLRLGYLYNDSSITASSEAPALRGLRLPEVPKGSFTAGVDGRAPFGITASAQIRWIGMQFDDNANTLRLPAATVVDAELSRRLGPRVEIYLAADNAGNARVATSLSTAGLYTYDVPRLIRGGLRVAW